MVYFWTPSNGFPLYKMLQFSHQIWKMYKIIYHLLLLFTVQREKKLIKHQFFHSEGKIKSCQNNGISSLYNDFLMLKEVSFINVTLCIISLLGIESGDN